MADETTDEDGNASLDKRIGENVAQFRGTMSQANLAILMRRSGFKWSQATVWSIEQGERPLRLSEAEVLGRILGTDPANFLADRDRARLMALRDEIVKSKDLIGAYAADLAQAQRDLRDFLGTQEFPREDDQLMIAQMLAIDALEIVKWAATLPDKPRAQPDSDG